MRNLLLVLVAWLLTDYAGAAESEQQRSLRSLTPTPDAVDAAQMPLDVEVSLDPTSPSPDVVPLGTNLTFHIATEPGAVVYVFNLNADGVLRIVYPNDLDEGAFVGQDGRLTIPEPDAGYTLKATGPEGSDLVKVIAMAGDVKPFEQLTYEFFLEQEPYPEARNTSRTVSAIASFFLEQSGEIRWAEWSKTFDVTGQ